MMRAIGRRRSFSPRMRRIQKDRLYVRLLVSTMSPVNKETAMQPTKAVRWFGPIMLASAIAALLAILLSAFVQSRLLSVEPEMRQLVASPAQSGVVERPPIVVTIEPSRIEVIGRRRATVFETIADWLPRRGDASSNTSNGMRNVVSRAGCEASRSEARDSTTSVRRAPSEDTTKQPARAAVPHQ
ncbi:MAG: hypothetical protein M3R31_11975 [Pseudomonadota bacterium]|nr:hypothetical protein [Pseudomonadota bacterium]